MHPQEAKLMLQMLFQSDYRLQVHTFELIENVAKHTKKCPRCCGLFVLGYPLDNEIAIDYN